MSNSRSGKIFNRAGSPGGGKSAAQIVRGANRWRDQYNPLRSLTIARVVAIIEAAERGDFAELQLVMRKLERRYPVLKGLKARRLAALEKLDWDIKVMDPLPEGFTEAQAEAQQKFLRSRYDLVENLTDAFGFLATAEFRGYAILQKHRYSEGGASVPASRNAGAVRELHWLPQDQFSRAGQFGDFFYNQDSRFGIGGDTCAATLGEANRIGGEQLPRAEFVVREVDDPLYEIALSAFVNWAMGRKDYAAFVEIFGLPNAVAILPPNIPAGQEDAYRDAAEKVADGVSGALPNGADVKFPTASVRGEAPFKTYCDANDADVVLAGTGGRLAMLTADKGGLGDGPSAEHADAFDEIAQADARKINAVLQRDFDRVELAKEFPSQPPLVYFELCAVEEEDATEVINNIVALKTAGYRVKTEQVEEKTGYELEEVEETPPNDPANPGRAGTPLPAAENEDDGAQGIARPTIQNRSGHPSPAAALAATFTPVIHRLAAINAVTDDATRTALLQKFLADETELRTALAADPSLARALAPQLAAALTKGLNA